MPGVADGGKEILCRTKYTSLSPSLSLCFHTVTKMHYHNNTLSGYLSFCLLSVIKERLHVKKYMKKLLPASELLPCLLGGMCRLVSELLTFSLHLSECYNY